MNLVNFLLDCSGIKDYYRNRKLKEGNENEEIFPEVALEVTALWNKYLEGDSANVR